MRNVGWVILLTLAAPTVLAVETWEPARTSWGAPDLNGFWNYRSLTPLERPEAYVDKSLPEKARAQRGVE